MSESTEKDLLVSFLDVEPPMIGGATLPELVLLLKHYALVNLVIGLLIGLLVGKFIVLIVGFFVIIVTFSELWITSTWLKGYKRGKPPGYFLQSVFKKMTKLGIKKPSFIEHEGYWY